VEAASASAAIDLAEAELAAARVQLERTRLLAPVDAVVIARNVEPGERAEPGGTLLVLARTGLTQLVIEPDERNLSLLRVGQPATASAEAFPERRFPARVSFIAPSVDPKRGTVEVRLEVPKPPEYLRTAMTVSVEVEVARKARALVLAADAVRDLGGDRPWVLVARDGRAERADVVLGVRGDRQVEVVSGIDPATRVISASAPRVAPGKRIRAAVK
jgi:HlyD family secretion protein